MPFGYDEEGLTALHEAGEDAMWIGFGIILLAAVPLGCSMDPDFLLGSEAHTFRTGPIGPTAVAVLRYIAGGMAALGIGLIITGFVWCRIDLKRYHKRTGLDRDYALRKERWKRERQERRQEKRDERQAIRDRRKMRKASEARRK